MTIREAVLLAAGLGKRFYKECGVHKLVAKIGGVPLIQFPLITLILSGIERFVIVVSKFSKHYVESEVRKCSKDFGVDIELVLNPEPERGNGYSLIVALPYLTYNQFLLSMSDHIYPPTLAELLIHGGSDGIYLGGDSRPMYVDPDEATRIRVERGVVVDIGKGITPYDYIDVGVHVLSTKAPYSDCNKSEVLELSSLIRCLAQKDIVRVVDVLGIPWTDIDTYSDYLELLSGKRRAVLNEVLREWSERGYRV